MSGSLRTMPKARLLALAWLFGVASWHSTWASVVEGFADPFRQIELATGAETGVLAEVLVREGSWVREGQVVATLDNRVLEISLDISARRAEFDGRLHAAQAEAVIRQRRLEKLLELQQQGHASPAEIDRAEADAAIAAAQVTLALEDRELARLECERIRAQIEQRRLRSPIDGVVVEVFREAGESVLFSDPRVMTLVQLHPLRVKFPVTIGQSLEFQAGRKVSIQLPEFQATVVGEVEVVSPVLDAKSGTVQVTCLIDNSGAKYRSGMRCLLKVKGEPVNTTRGDSDLDFTTSD